MAAGAAPARRRAERAARRARRRRLRAARLLRLRHRHAEPRPPGRRRAALRQLPHHRAVLAHPRVRAHRPQPPQRRAWAASSTWPPASPATTPASRRSCALLPAMLTPHGYAAYAVGKWHLTPEDEEHLGARRDRWPLGRGLRALVRVLPRRDPPVRAGADPRQPPRRAARHRTRTATTSPTDLVDHAIEWVEDLRNVDVDKPWLLYLATGACHSPHQAPAEWIERYRGHFDQGWDAWREAALARQKAAGLLPEHTELSPRPDWVPAWDDLADDERARLRPLHGGLRRLPLPHRPRARPAVRPARRARRARRHARGGAVRQRRVVRGRADRLAQRRPGVERAAPHGGGGGRAARRDRRAAHPQQLPVGLDGRRQHAVPPVEARDARGRRGRPAHRPLARRHRRARRGAAPVRPRHRPAARRSSTPSASSRPPRSPASRSSRSTA